MQILVLISRGFLFRGILPELHLQTPHLTDCNAACSPERHTDDFASRENGTQWLVGSRLGRDGRWCRELGSVRWFVSGETRTVSFIPRTQRRTTNRRRPGIGWFRIVRRQIGLTPSELPAFRCFAVVLSKYKFVSHFRHPLCLFTECQSDFRKRLFVFGMTVK